MIHAPAIIRSQPCPRGITSRSRSAACDGAIFDAAGPDAGSLRVIRGGNYRSAAAALCRSAFRYHRIPVNRYSSVGFRVVCELE